MLSSFFLKVFEKVISISVGKGINEENLSILTNKLTSQGNPVIFLRINW